MIGGLNAICPLAHRATAGHGRFIAYHVIPSALLSLVGNVHFELLLWKLFLLPFVMVILGNNTTI
jgi:hypothetical protein